MSADTALLKQIAHMMVNDHFGPPLYSAILALLRTRFGDDFVDSLERDRNQRLLAELLVGAEGAFAELARKHQVVEGLRRCRTPHSSRSLSFMTCRAR